MGRHRVSRAAGWTARGTVDGPRATDSPDPGTPEAAWAKVATEPVGSPARTRCRCECSARPGARLDRLTPRSSGGGTPRTRPWAGPGRRGQGRRGAAHDHHQVTVGADDSLRTCDPDLRRQHQGVGGPPHGELELLRRGGRAPTPARHLRLPRRRQRLVRRGLQLLRRPLRPALRGSLRRREQERRGRAGPGLQLPDRRHLLPGNHDSASTGAIALSSAVLTAVGKLVAWKGWLAGWDPATSVSYTSAGSPRAAGAVVTTPRVSGHRDFNLTSCPGDHMYTRLSTIRSTATAVYNGLTTTPAVPPSTSWRPGPVRRGPPSRCPAGASATGWA